MDLRTRLGLPCLTVCYINITNGLRCQLFVLVLSCMITVTDNPSLTDFQEAQTLAKQIIDRGKEVFSKKCYLDALWKYDNAYQLCCVKCVSSNIKGRALLGCATASFELLKQSSSYERNLFGQYTDSCLSECINSAFPLKFQSKVGMIYLVTFH